MKTYTAAEIASMGELMAQDEATAREAFRTASAVYSAAAKATNDACVDKDINPDGFYRAAEAEAWKQSIIALWKKRISIAFPL